MLNKYFYLTRQLIACNSYFIYESSTIDLIFDWYFYVNFIQQLGTDVFGYETMLVYQVNVYETPDGCKPFGKAPDSQVAICSLKMID